MHHNSEIIGSTAWAVLPAEWSTGTKNNSHMGATKPQQRRPMLMFNVNTQVQDFGHNAIGTKTPGGTVRRNETNDPIENNDIERSDRKNGHASDITIVDCAAMQTNNTNDTRNTSNASKRENSEKVSRTTGRQQRKKVIGSSVTGNTDGEANSNPATSDSTRKPKPIDNVGLDQHGQKRTAGQHGHVDNNSSQEESMYKTAPRQPFNEPQCASTRTILQTQILTRPTSRNVGTSSGETLQQQKQSLNDILTNAISNFHTAAS